MKSRAVRGHLYGYDLSEEERIGLTGFLIAGLFDYTYGHSLSLILLSFAVLPALSVSPEPSEDPPGGG